MSKAALIATLTTAILAASAVADGQTAIDASGVWYGTYTEPTEERDSDSAFGAGGGRQPTPALYLLSIEAQGTELTGTLLIGRSRPNGQYFRDSAMASLGVASANPRYNPPEADAITGTVVGDKISIVTVPSLTKWQIRGEGRVRENAMRLEVAVGPATNRVQLRRCVPGEGETFAEACSTETLWREYLERNARGQR